MIWLFIAVFSLYNDFSQIEHPSMVGKWSETVLRLDDEECVIDTTLNYVGEWTYEFLESGTYVQNGDGKAECNGIKFDTGGPWSFDNGTLKMGYVSPCNHIDVLFEYDQIHWVNHDLWYVCESESDDFHIISVYQRLKQS